MMNSEEKRESSRKSRAAWCARNPEKARKSAAEWRARNPEKAREATAKWQAENVERCAEVSARWYAENLEKAKSTKVRWKKENPEKYLLNTAKARAKEKDIPFSITVEDIVIPEKCPALGTPFKTGTQQAASLDRIVPVLGYIPGNVQVISRRANMIKHNADSEEIQAVCDWLRNVEKS